MKILSAFGMSYGVIVGVFRVVAIRILQKTELRIHFEIEILLWAARHRVEFAFDLVDDVLPVRSQIRNADFRRQRS